VTAPHLFEALAGSDAWHAWDQTLADQLTRPVLEHAVAEVPTSFLVPLLPRATASDPEAVRRRRAAYVAFLWKRLQPTRAFMETDAA